MLTGAPLWVAIVTMVPLMIFTAIWDARTLKIPNWIPLAAVAIYVATGLWGLDLETFLWGLGAGFGVLVLFFLMYSALYYAGVGGVGAGDLKLMSAMVPFIALNDAFIVLVIYTIATVLLALVFAVLWARQAKRTEDSAWESLNQTGQRFRKRTPPVGVAIAAAMLIYLTLLALRDLGAI